MNGELWVKALAGLEWMTTLYARLDRGDATEALADLVDAARKGKVGKDLAVVVRQSFQRLSRQGWNEVGGIDVLDGLMAGFNHYQDSYRIGLEWLAIEEMMDAEIAGDYTRASTIQKALWEWELAVPEISDGSIYEAVVDTSFDDRLSEVYGEWQAAQARAACRLVIGENDDEIPTLVEFTTEEAKKAEYVPISLQPDWNPDKVLQAIRRIGRDAEKLLAHWSSERGREFLKKFRCATATLTDGEKARVISWMDRKATQRLGRETTIVKWIVDHTKIDLNDDEAEFVLFDRENLHFTLPQSEVSRDAVNGLYEVISLPPEHPKWHPTHSLTFLEGSGLLTTRVAVRKCFKAGWAAYKRDPLRGAYSRRHNLGQLNAKIVGEAGIGDGNGRFWSWDALQVPANHIYGMIKGDNVKAICTKLSLLEHPEAQRVMEVLQ